MKKMCYNLKTV